METKVFQRIEKKYLITPAESDKIISTIKSYMKEDAYHKSEIYNIYYDNDNYDLITQSIDHPVFKQKLRARSYGGYDKVFLEIKTKLSRDEMQLDGDESSEENVGFKRRVLISRSDYNEYLNHAANMITLATNGSDRPADFQIAREIDYMVEHFTLKPQVLVYYNRESYAGEDGLRITFDSHLGYRDKNLSFTKSCSDHDYFGETPKVIMEIKAQGFLPLWLTSLMSEAKIYPTRFSKIGNIYQQIRKEQNV